VTATTGTEPPAVPRQRRFVAQVMGTTVTLALRGRHVDDGAARRAWRDCREELRRADRLFSTYREDSFVSRLGRGEVSVGAGPAEVAEVLAIGERARVASGGAFDVRRPGPDGTLVLDPSGVVKGWAVQRASAAVLALDDTDVCLAAGGDLVCHVAAADREPWQVGIEDPLDPARVVARVPVRRGAVATSGHTHRGDHVVDARTGRPPEGVASVTVLADDLVTADVDATAAYAMGRAGVAWLESRGRTGVVVWSDGSADVYGSPA
jgi:FAD:protein FMN transferase